VGAKADVTQSAKKGGPRMPARTGVKVETEFARPIEEVWPFFADFENMPKATAGVSGVTMTGEGVGCTRRVHFADRFTDERLEVMDPAAHRIVYRVTAKSPTLAFEDYTAEMKLTPVDAGRCAFHWESRFTVADGTEPDSVRAILRRSYGIALEGFHAAIDGARQVRAGIP
jgi:carbon monoxide dehydrogenase subunit G